MTKIPNNHYNTVQEFDARHYPNTEKGELDTPMLSQVQQQLNELRWTVDDAELLREKIEDMISPILRLPTKEANDAKNPGIDSTPLVQLAQEIYRITERVRNTNTLKNDEY